MWKGWPSEEVSGMSESCNVKAIGGQVFGARGGNGHLAFRLHEGLVGHRTVRGHVEALSQDHTLIRSDDPRRPRITAVWCGR